MVWRYKRQYTDKTLSFRKSVYASERTAFYFNILWVLQLLCRYKLHAYRLICKDKFPKIPTKLREKCMWGGGQLPPAPPPPLATLVGWGTGAGDQGRRNVFSFGGGGKDKKGHCNVKKGTSGVHADNYHQCVNEASL